MWWSKFAKNGQKFPCGGLIGYGKSCIDVFIGKSNIFRDYAFLLKSAGFVKSTKHTCSGFCYVEPRFPSLCFFVPLIGLLLCLYVNIFASTLYALFDC